MLMHDEGTCETDIPYARGTRDGPMLPSVVKATMEHSHYKVALDAASTPVLPAVRPHWPTGHELAKARRMPS